MSILLLARRLGDVRLRFMWRRGEGEEDHPASPPRLVTWRPYFTATSTPTKALSDPSYLTALLDLL